MDDRSQQWLQLTGPNDQNWPQAWVAVFHYFTIYFIQALLLVKYLVHVPVRTETLSDDLFHIYGPDTDSIISCTWFLGGLLNSITQWRGVDAILKKAFHFLARHAASSVEPNRFSVGRLCGGDGAACKATRQFSGISLPCTAVCYCRWNCSDDDDQSPVVLSARILFLVQSDCNSAQII